MIPRAYIAAAILALIAASGAWGYRTGYHASQNAYAIALAKAQAAQMRAAEASSRAEALRLAAEAETASMARELEDQANADVDAGRIGLGVAGVRRLGKR